MRVAVCSPQVPFAHGGAEVLAERLTEELQARGHEAALVTVPFKWYPGQRVLTQAFLWRMVDLEEVDGRPVDLVIGTKFPSYVVRHPNKIVWLVHQFRQAYELDGTELGQFGDDPVDRATRRAIHRLDRAKRIDLLLDAVAGDPAARVVIAGEGPDRERLEQIAHDHGLDGRARFAGRVDQAELADLYARCLAVYYAPVDEDYGMVPYEAFLSQKPVVTTTDAGGPLAVVSDRRTGLVVEPRTDSVAGAVRFLREHPDDARSWGRAGKEVAEQVTWDHAIERLLS